MKASLIEDVLKELGGNKINQWKGAIDVIGDGIKGKPIKSIGNLGKGTLEEQVAKTRGLAGVVTRMGTKQGEKYGLGEAFKEAYSKSGTGKGGFDYGAIAGSYLGVATGYRALSGGGLYKDKDGNTNLIGVPFV